MTSSERYAGSMLFWLYLEWRMIVRILKAILIAAMSIIGGLILLVNFRIHHSPEVTLLAHDTISLELVSELRGLRYAQEHNADADMQLLYPEGYMFFNSLYGLAWCNFLDRHPNRSVYYKEGELALTEIWSRINSEQGREPFTSDLAIPNGAFYTGWSTYFLGRKIQSLSASALHAEETELFSKNCAAIAKALSEKIYPESYRDGAWPADVMVCVAALRLHDKINAAIYTQTINSWLTKVKSKTDTHGLIPHAANSITGTTVEAARGSSQSLILIFLNEIDPQFAREQFSIYKRLFLQAHFGLVAVREYPAGTTGVDDVDTGPIVWDIGSSATITGMQTLRCMNDPGGTMLQNSIEAFGFPSVKDGRKCYLYGQLPIADAFLTWGHSVESSARPVSFLNFHFWSFGILVVLLIAGRAVYNYR